MKTPNDTGSQNGVALAATLLLILLLGVMASGLVSLLMEEGTLSANRAEVAKAESLAGAAESFAMAKMNERSGWETWTGIVSESLGGGQISVQVESVSSDEKRLRCTGSLGRSKVVRARTVRRGPLAAEGEVSVTLSDNRWLLSDPDFVLLTTRFDNPSNANQGGGMGDRVLAHVCGIDLVPGGRNRVRLEQLNGSVSSPDPWSEEAFRYDAANDWLEAAFRLPEADNNGQEWGNRFVNLGVEIETVPITGLDYVPGSRRRNTNHRLVCDIKNNTGETVVLTAMTVSWGQPEAHYEEIQIRVIGGSNYRAVWRYPGRRAGSGEKVVFNQGKTVSIPADATFRIQVLNFRSTPTGGGPRVDMDDTAFQITFFAGETEYPETTVPVYGEPVETSLFKVWQAIRIGNARPVVRVFGSASAREEEGEGLRRWRLVQGRTFYFRVWADDLSGALKSGEGKLRIVTFFDEETYGDDDAFSEVSGGGRYDARLDVPAMRGRLPEGWSEMPQRGWDYVLWVELKDRFENPLRYASVVRIQGLTVSEIEMREPVEFREVEGSLGR